MSYVILISWYSRSSHFTQKKSCLEFSKFHISSSCQVTLVQQGYPSNLQPMQRQLSCWLPLRPKIESWRFLKGFLRCQSSGFANKQDHYCNWSIETIFVGHWAIKNVNLKWPHLKAMSPCDSMWHAWGTKLRASMTSATTVAPPL